jgi:hypothetical protein
MLELNLDEEHADNDIIFDRAAESAGSLIAGGYYLVRPTASSKNFFKRLSNDLQYWYAPDNAYMTSLCSDKELANCGQIPFRFDLFAVLIIIFKYNHKLDLASRALTI